jgi:hypothetical protein
LTFPRKLRNGSICFGLSTTGLFSRPSERKIPDLPFYKTATFYICAIALVILLPLGLFVLKHANAQTPGEKHTPLVEFAMNPATKAHLSTALTWDFGFIPIYVLFLSLACFFVARLTGAPLRLTWMIIAVVIVGALIDVCENLTLFHVIRTSQDDGWATLARTLEIVKWVAPAIAGIYLVTTVIWGIIKCLRKVL